MSGIAGLVLITPTSVSGSGVSLSGAKVEFTSATAVSVNGVFTATYGNYLVVARHWNNATSGAPAMRIRVRAAGSDNSAASSYEFQTLNVASTTPSASRNVGDVANVSESNQRRRSGFQLYLYGPYLSQHTVMRSISADARDDGHINETAIRHNVSSSFDGFTIFPSSDSINGSLTIYGLAE